MEPLNPYQPHFLAIVDFLYIIASGGNSGVKVKSGTKLLPHTIATCLTHEQFTESPLLLDGTKVLSWLHSKWAVLRYVPL